MNASPTSHLLSNGLNPNNKMNFDPDLSEFVGLYGSEHEPHHLIPTINQVIAHRQANLLENIREVTVDDKVANFRERVDESNYNFIKTRPTWARDKNSMLYVITKKENQIITADPICSETTVPSGPSYLRGISFNLSSCDIYNSNETMPTKCYVNALDIGTIVCVLELAYITVAKKEEPDRAIRYYTAVKYYIIQPDKLIQRCLAMAVLETSKKGYRVYPSFKERDITCRSGYLRINVVVSKLKLKPGKAPPTMFVIRGTFRIPHPRVNTLCHNAPSDFSGDTARTFITNSIGAQAEHTKPYSPSCRVLEWKRLDEDLDAMFKIKKDKKEKDKTNADAVAFNAINLIHNVVRISSQFDIGTDYRLLKSKIAGVHNNVDQLYLALQTRAQLSYRMWQIGKLVKVHCLANCLIVGRVVEIGPSQLNADGSILETKITLSVNKNCAIIKEGRIAPNMEAYKTGLKILNTKTASEFLAIQMVEDTCYDPLFRKDNNVEMNFSLLENHILNGYECHGRNLVPPIRPPNEQSQYMTTDEEVDLLRELIGSRPTVHQRLIYCAVVDLLVSKHDGDYIEIRAAFGSGKSNTLVSVGLTIITMENKYEHPTVVVFTAQENDAVTALASKLPNDLRGVYRPLILRSYDWKAGFIPNNETYELETLKKDVFTNWLQQDFNPTTADDHNKRIAVYLYRSLTKFEATVVLNREVETHCQNFFISEQTKKKDNFDEDSFFYYMYKPNVIFGTMNMIGSNLNYLPPIGICCIDDVGMSLPADVFLFSYTLRMQNNDKIKFILAGDLCQFESYSRAREFAKYVVPTQKLLQYSNDGYVLSRVFRTHPHTTKILSKFYPGGLEAAPDKLAQTDYFQETLSADLVPNGRTKAFHLFSQRYATRKVGQSRQCQGEVTRIEQYVTRLLKEGVQRAQITVLTPYSAQCALLRTSQILRNVTVSTVRGYQGKENRIIIFSSAYSNKNVEEQFHAPVAKEADDDDNDVVPTEEEHLHMIGERSTIVVALSRAQDFSALFMAPDVFDKYSIWQNLMSEWNKPFEFAPPESST